MFASLVRMNRQVWLAGTLMLGMTVSVLADEVEAQKTGGSGSGKGSWSAMARYQVAAGTALLLKLRTPLDSASTSVDEQVEATLWSPVVQDGVELVPDGSVVLGRVVAVTRASEKARGAITFVFSIIEHAGTGSREALATRKVVMAATPEPDAGRGKRRPKPVEAVIPQGTPFSAVTAEPLVVWIPR